MTSTPMKIGMYLFPRMMTRKSTPVVVTVSLERVTVASADQVLLDSPPAYLQVKPGKVTGALTLIGNGNKFLLAGLGSNAAGSFTPEQEAEIYAAQQVAAQDPQLQQLRLAQTFWVGRPVSADGSYVGAINSMLDGEGKAQQEVGKIVVEALSAAGTKLV
ncbi:hypothetical protein VR010_05980 [Actinomycetaceae bacterium L2_0104]